jgi:Zn ribbon nucleic-acid-binding protein
MKITCPNCKDCKAKNIIRNVAIIAFACVFCGHAIFNHNDDLPHQTSSTQPINTINVIATGTVSGSTLHTTTLTEIKGWK